VAIEAANCALFLNSNRGLRGTHPACRQRLYTSSFLYTHNPVSISSVPYSNSPGLSATDAHSRCTARSVIDFKCPLFQLTRLVAHGRPQPLHCQVRYRFQVSPIPTHPACRPRTPTASALPGPVSISSVTYSNSPGLSPTDAHSLCTARSVASARRTASSSRCPCRTAMQKVRVVRLGFWHLVLENGYWMMDKSKTPRRKVR
jgi:hypothetical protein